MKTQEFIIEGMSCNHCVMAVKKELEKLSGVSISSVEVGKAVVQFDETQVPVNHLVQAIEKAGFKVR